MNKDSHLTLKEDFKLKDFKYHQEDVDSKPQGLWYQINDSWEEWCKYNMPEWLGVGNRAGYKVHLEIDKSNVLIISNLEEFDLFHNTYCTSHPFLKSASLINWKKLSESYDGIEISDYFYQRRLEEHCSWYYPWDVASGCIWNTNIIKMIGNINAINHATCLYS